MVDVCGVHNAAAGDGHQPVAGQGAGVVAGGNDGEPEDGGQASRRDAGGCWGRANHGLKPHGYRQAVAPRQGETSKVPGPRSKVMGERQKFGKRNPPSPRLRTPDVGWKIGEPFLRPPRQAFVA